MSELETQLRSLVERDARPITFEEVAHAPVQSTRRTPRPLTAVACGVGVLVVAVGAMVMSGVGSDGSTKVRSSPSVSAPGSSRPKVFTLPSESMSPTLRAGDRYSVETLAYATRDPARGDIVALHVPAGSEITDKAQLLVKRIVGLPGETVEGRDGRIFVNGEALDEAGYLPIVVRSKVFGPVTVPRGMFFVLGDNRQYSNDSTIFGPVTRSALVGPVTKVR